MNELSNEEMEMVTGAGWLRETFDDLEYVVGGINRLYKKSISAASDLMCTGTGNC